MFGDSFYFHWIKPLVPRLQQSVAEGFLPCSAAVKHLVFFQARASWSTLRGRGVVVSSDRQYCNPRAHARRALTIKEVCFPINTVNTSFL